MFLARGKEAAGSVTLRLAPWSWETEILNPKAWPARTLATVICGSWVVWTMRNSHRHGRKVWEPNAAARFVPKLMEDLASLKLPPSRGKEQKVAQCEKSEGGWLRVNNDAGHRGLSLFEIST